MAILLSVAAHAERRLAVHPLELGNFSAAEEATLKAQFDVMVARVAGVKLAGSTRIDETLLKAAASRCEVRDSCLRFLAESTDSLYGMYMRLDSSPAGVVATARVVRSDGVTVRRAVVEAATAREALVRTLAELKLDALEATLPTADLPMAELTPPPLPLPDVEQPPAPLTMTRAEAAPPREWKRVAGWGLVGVGGVTLATGGVVAAMAASKAAANPPTASGLVTAERAEGAASALEQSRVAVVLIPTGATLAVVGAILLMLPRSAESNPVAFGVTPIGGGLVGSVSGQLP